jgi:toxin ParE1/3/4
LDDTVDPAVEEAWSLEIAHRIGELDSQGETGPVGRGAASNLRNTAWSLSRLRFIPQRWQNWEAAVVWYLARSETAASKFPAEVDQVIEQIAEFPQRWPVADQGTQRLVMHRFPFAVVYREKQRVVQVLAIAHGHRRPRILERTALTVKFPELG